jgi:hypothetical protein
MISTTYIKFASNYTSHNKQPPCQTWIYCGIQLYFCQKTLLSADFYRNQKNPVIARNATPPIYTERFTPPQSMPCATAARPQFFMRLQIPFHPARKFFPAANEEPLDLGTALSSQGNESYPSSPNTEIEWAAASWRSFSGSNKSVLPDSTPIAAILASAAV